MSDELKPWECFQDASYYDMWLVRRTKNRTFGEGFHLIRGEEAAALCELLNTLHQPEAPPSVAKQRPWCDTCGATVHEILCPTCAKWWDDNKPEVSDDDGVLEVLPPILRAREAAARREGYEAARDEAARVVEAISDDYTLAWRDGHKASSYLEGQSDGTEVAAAAIGNMGE